MSSRKASSSSNLPKLPAQPLFRFKTVCKNWLSSISTSTFLKSHLEFSSLSPKFLLFHVNSRCRMFLLSYDESKTTVNDLVELHSNDLNEQSESFFIVDTCNGLLCLYLMDRYLFTLWNPVTNQYKTVPHYSRTIDDADYDVSLAAVGFGYASLIEDYKILAIYNSTWDDDFGYFYLFSMNTGTWRRLSYLDGTYYSSALCKVKAVCIDDTLYWPFSNLETRAMVGVVGFDLVHDQMKKVLKVPWLSNYGKVDQIFKMKGCLSLCCCKENSHVYDVWMLKQHGGPKIWLKLVSIDRRIGPVLGFTGNGKYLVQHPGQLKMIDPNKQDTDLLETGVDCDCEILEPARKYVESLIPF